MKGKLELYEHTMEKLQKTWENNEFRLRERHGTQAGIRSSQVAALVLLLIELGIIKD